MDQDDETRLAEVRREEDREDRRLQEVSPRLQAKRERDRAYYHRKKKRQEEARARRAAAEAAAARNRELLVVAG